MKKLDWTLVVAALVLGAPAIGCGEQGGAERGPVSATAPAEPEPAEPSEPLAQLDEAADEGEADEPLVPVDFEESSIELVTTETLEEQLAELETALADEDLGDDAEDEE